MLGSKTIVLFSCVVCILTVTASNEIKTSGTPEKLTANSSTIIEKNEHTVTEAVNANRTNLLYAEGGLIVSSQSPQLPTSGHKDEAKTDGIDTVKDQSLTVKKDLDLPIVDREKGNLIQDQLITKNNVTKEIHSDDNISETISKIKNGNHTSNASSETSTVAISTVNATKVHSPKTPKPKPTATIGSNKPLHSLPIESSSGRSRKIDYIIPVAITVVALPIISAIAFIVYTRGRDCWDKRHYRRMDFLIDGMYND